MSSPDHLCPPLGNLLVPTELRLSATAFEATASDDTIVAELARRRACWRIAAALRLAAIIIESGEANTGGHLAALGLEMLESAAGK